MGASVHVRGGRDEPQRRFDAFISLSPVAEPDAYDLLVEPQPGRQVRYLRRRRFRLGSEVQFQRIFGAQADRRSSFSSPVRRSYVQSHRVSQCEYVYAVVTRHNYDSSRLRFHGRSTVVWWSFDCLRSKRYSGCVVECRICNRQVARSNLGRGYTFERRSTQPSIPPGSVNENQLRLGRQMQV